MAFDAILQSLLSGFPFLILHFTVPVGIWLVGVWLYVLSTPYREMDLIRQNNPAAAITLSGAMLGLALPLGFAMASSVNVLDILIWGCVTVAIQIAVYRVVDLVLRDLPRRIAAGEIAAALTASAVKLSIAVFNAAAVSG